MITDTASLVAEEATKLPPSQAICKGSEEGPSPHYLLPVCHGCPLASAYTIPAVSGDIPPRTILLPP